MTLPHSPTVPRGSLIAFLRKKSEIERRQPCRRFWEMQGAPQNRSRQLFHPARGFPRSNERLGLLADVSLSRIARLQRDRLELEALDQRHLGDRKNHRQRDHAEGLEADPEIGALR